MGSAIKLGSLCVIKSLCVNRITQRNICQGPPRAQIVGIFEMCFKEIECKGVDSDGVGPVT
jgi:hypothetical protein